MGFINHRYYRNHFIEKNGVAKNVLYHFGLAILRRYFQTNQSIGLNIYLFIFRPFFWKWQIMIEKQIVVKV